MVGNGCTDWHYDTTPAFIEMAYWHGLYDQDLYQSITDNNCEPEFTRFSTEISPVCLKNYENFSKVTTGAGINVYDVYGICYPAPTEKTQNDSFEIYESKEVGITKIGNEIKTYKRQMSAKDYTPWLFRNEADPSTHHL